MGHGLCVSQASMLPAGTYPVSVCSGGHYYWDNDEAANVACRQMGFAGGQIYTFGSTRLLPTLPIVAGWHLCAGTERNLFECEDKSWSGDVSCSAGCPGPDGIIGTGDDTVSPDCTHAIDQGVMCEREGSSQAVNPNLQRCSGCGGGGCQLADAGLDRNDQAVSFSCIEFYSTSCVYDLTNEQLANNMGSYMRAVRAFATCADVQPEPDGYCHGSLHDASKLANHEVCVGSNVADDDWRSRL